MYVCTIHDGSLTVGCQIFESAMYFVYRMFLKCLTEWTGSEEDIDMKLFALSRCITFVDGIEMFSSKFVPYTEFYLLIFYFFYLKKDISSPGPKN